VESVTWGAIGYTSIIANDTILYTPYPNQYGDDIFTYIVSDGNDTAAASVSVTIEPVEDSPLAVNDFITTNEDTPVIINVMGNDSEPDGDPLTITGNTTPSFGTIILNADNTFTYSPDTNINGTDGFTYTLDDGKGHIDMADVAVTITSVNDLPVGIDDFAITSQNTSVTINVIANDVDEDGDVLTISGVLKPTGKKNSTVLIISSNELLYEPKSGFIGQESYTYTVSDGNGGTASASVHVEVVESVSASSNGEDPVTSEATTTAKEALDNAGFESGDFKGWLTIGESVVETAAFGSGPSEGTFQVVLSTAGPVEAPEDSTGYAVSASELEIFLQLPSGRLDEIGTGPAIEGSAIKRTFAANAGDVLSFDWNFLTNEYTILDEPDSPPTDYNNDFAFVSITEVSQLSDTFSMFIFSISDYMSETGFDTFFFPITTTGAFSLGIGVVDVGDEEIPSALLIDNFLLNPGNQ
jgi:hypothetical protein